jgi:hypothetical protein
LGLAVLEYDQRLSRPKSGLERTLPERCTGKPWGQLYYYIDNKSEANRN